MDNLSAQQKLMGNMQATSAELLSGIMEERGRGFASDREAWAQLKELKDARQTVELMDACGKRVCSSEEHWGCPYGNEGMTDCAVLLEAAYEDTIEKLLALKETLEG